MSTTIGRLKIVIVTTEEIYIIKDGINLLWNSDRGFSERLRQRVERLCCVLCYALFHDEERFV